MSEPAEMISEDARRKSDQSLLLARVFASVVTLGVGLTCLLAGPVAMKFGTMFAELGVELPVISRLIVGFPGVWMIGMLALIAVTLFFIWAKGRAAAWMAGLGLLILAVGLPIIVFSLFLPLVKIVNEMGNM
jgi:hypothetical protein